MACESKPNNVGPKSIRSAFEEDFIFRLVFEIHRSLLKESLSNLNLIPNNIDAVVKHP